MHLEANTKEKEGNDLEKDSLREKVFDLEKSLKGYTDQHEDILEENKMMKQKVKALELALDNTTKSTEGELKVLQNRINTGKEEIRELIGERDAMEKKMNQAMKKSRHAEELHKKEIGGMQKKIDIHVKEIKSLNVLLEK